MAKTALVTGASSGTDYPDIVFANLGPDPVLPDAVDTVLEVELTE